MQCRNGSESRHLINMPFIWPLHTSLKQEPLLQHRAAQGASLQPVPENCSLLLVQAAHPGALATKCSQQKLCGSFAIASIATPPRLSPPQIWVCTACKSRPFVYPFVLIYLHVICFAFACSVSVFRALCAGTVTFAGTPVTYDCCVHYQYALCE